MSQFFEGDPKSWQGLVGWAGLGALAALLALGVGTIFPSIIPARASQSRL
jgi:hypothetical protein